MLDAQQTPIVALVGGAGTGKTTLLRLLLARERRAILIDPQAEHEGNVLALHASDGLWLLDRLDRLDSWGLAVIRLDNDAGFLPLVERLGRMERVVVAVDELGWLVGPRWNPEPLERLARFARHRRSPFIWTSQRLTDVPALLYSYADISFLHMHGPSDLDIVRRIAGPETADAVREMPRFQGIRRTLEGKVFKFSLDRNDGSDRLISGAPDWRE